jgi:hypothetical protein
MIYLQDKWICTQLLLYNSNPWEPRNSKSINGQNKILSDNQGCDHAVSICDPIKKVPLYIYVSLEVYFSSYSLLEIRIQIPLAHFIAET